MRLDPVDREPLRRPQAAAGQAEAARFGPRESLPRPQAARADQSAAARRFEPLGSAGRWAGSLFLAAFGLYGVGSMLARAGAQRDDLALLVAGAALIAANSVAVVLIARLLTPLVRERDRRAAQVYRATRWAEALLLAAGGLVLVLGGPSRPTGALRAHDLIYLVAMTVLGVGSLPLLGALARQRLVPVWLARWGQAGYLLLSLGSVLQLAGFGWALALCGPGGLFELAFGLWLVGAGSRFRRPTAQPAPDPVPGRRV